MTVGWTLRTMSNVTYILMQDQPEAGPAVERLKKYVSDILKKKQKSRRGNERRE